MITKAELTAKYNSTNGKRMPFSMKAVAVRFTLALLIYSFLG